MQLKKICSAALGLALSLTLVLPAAAYDSARENDSQTLSGGGGESFAIDGEGALWAWGSNEWGQLGDCWSMCAP